MVKDKTGIRLKFSSLVLYLSNLINTVLSIAYSVIVIRKLSIREYGVIALINRYALIASLGFPLYKGWTFRAVSRGYYDAVNTSLTTSLMLTLIGLLVYAGTISGVKELHSGFFELLIIGAALVPLIYTMHTLEAIVNGFMPHVLGYAQVIRRLSALAAAIVLVLFLRQGAYGALLATILGAICFIITLFKYILPLILKGNFNYEMFKSWIGSAWYYVYTVIPSFLGNIDAIIVAMLWGREDPVGVYQVALVITGTLTYTAGILTPLQARILAGTYEDRRRDIADMWVFSFLLISPICVGIFLFVKEILLVVGPQYLGAIRVLRIMTISALFTLILRLSETVVVGTDEVDLEGKVKVRELVGSRLFKNTTIMYLLRGLYIALLYTALIYIDEGAGYIEISEIWAWLTLMYVAIRACVLFIWSRSIVKFEVRYLKIIKYALLSVVSGAAAWLMKDSVVQLALTLPLTAFWRSLLSLSTLGATMASLYMMLVYLVDKDGREVIKAGFDSLKGTIRRLTEVR